MSVSHLVFTEGNRELNIMNYFYLYHLLIQGLLAAVFHKTVEEDIRLSSVALLYDRYSVIG